MRRRWKIACCGLSSQLGGLMDMPRIITFECKYDGLSIVQREGALPRSRLWAQAPGLDIYVSGTAKGTVHDSLTNMACNMALSMHIPLISLRYVQRGNK
jgi:hypothetical protein